jgi:heat-inducible transcriptional repressor
MRTLSPEEQGDRKVKLLQAVIHQYIKTGKPVGSAFLADQRHVALSPATIRHVMAELEEEGFLTHPHTSAGRVPTDKAYRFYVDSLADLQRLALIEEDRIRREYEDRIRQIEELMLTTSRTLSALSHFSGFVTPPRLEEARLRHVELVPLEGDRALVVLVSDTGMVKNRVVGFRRPIAADQLRSLARLLNEEFRGKTFSEVRDRILDRLDDLGQRQADLMDLARNFGREAFDLGGEEIYLEGAGNILALPDFRDFDQVRSLAQLLDEKSRIGEIITNGLSKGGDWGEGGLRVKIGSENKFPELRDLSLISATYTIQGRTVGVLGIIGPKRMEYPRMMSLVSYVAKSVSRFLDKLSGGRA